MEQNFETSFIPKKPVVAERVVRPRSVGLLTTVSIFILFTVLLATGGFYFYKLIMVKSVAKMENDLNLAKNRFEPAKIAELKVLDRRLNAGAEVLAHHITITPVFEALEGITMKTVRYTKFDYVLGTEVNPQVVIKLKGQAIGYRSIALQSDLYTANQHLIDPVFSNLTLDDKGNVLFDLDFKVDPSFVDYKQTLLTKSEGGN
jgi:hypothetical protein